MTSALKKIIVIAGMLMTMMTQVNGMEGYSTNCCEPIYCGTPEESNFYVFGDFLYWRPELCGLESAFGTTAITNAVNNGITTTTIVESDEKPHSKWSPGFRVGCGVEMDCYDAELRWTDFSGHATFNEKSQHGHWKIKYDVIDFTFGRQFSVTPCFYLRPYIGVRGAHIRQRLNSHLTASFTSGTVNSTVATDINDSEKFWGVGPQIGLDAIWNIGCDFSLYGGIAVVTYYGDANGKHRNTDTFASSASVCRGKKEHCFNNIGTDLSLGIRWDKSVQCGCRCFDFFVKLGAEQHRIYDFSNLGSDGTLSLDGGVLTAGVNYAF